MIRAVLALALIAAPIYLSMQLVPHHDGGGNLFHTLYSHVLPAHLEMPHEDGHGATVEGGAREVDEGFDPLHGHESHTAAIAVSAPFLPSIFHYTDTGHLEGKVPVFNLQIFQVFAVLLLLVCFSGVPATIRTGTGDWISRMFAGFALWVRDEMVVPIMGRETANKILPFLLCLFFFILFMNVMGLVPGGATATANIGVTGALATITFCSMIGLGMAVQGPAKFWANIVPHGLPVVFIPLMFVIEFIGLLVKPVALTIRLFANMTAGHLIVLSAMGLIYYFGEQSAALGWVAAPLAVGFAVFIMIIESFVAMLQAYIFTYLTILFVQACIHPEH